jgi:hypothetical protein
MENNQSDNVEGSAPPKFSRYRSVRVGMAKAASEPNPAPPLPASLDDTGGLNRAPSRYRRNRSQTSAGSPPPLPPVAPQSFPIQRPRKDTEPRKDCAEGKVSRAPAAAQPYHQHARSNTTGSLAQTQPSRYKRRAGRTNTTTSDSTRPPKAQTPLDAAREEARMMLEGEFDRMQGIKKVQAQQQFSVGSGAPDVRQRPAAASETGQEIEKATNEVRTKTPKGLKQPRAPDRDTEGPPQPKSPPMTKVRQFIIGSGANTAPRVKKQDAAGHSRKASKAADLEPTLQAPAPAPSHRPLAAVAPAPEAVRAFDAPISAVNAGDRRVEVKCNKAAITLPVTPSTTVQDLLNSASVVMSEQIDATTTVLIEAFSYLGLERPLRRYERIRDVMNSWSTDTQHHLVITAQSECSASGLDLKDAPSTAPQDSHVQMYVSSSPGKWDKRWIRLREDGQVTISKNENGKESTNICHLSDFDVYMPTAKEKKKLRTPKKICFAVKSQQKAAMFLKGENFAHFFCSNQKETADQLYRALHMWRTWYLVNVLGEGEKRRPDPRAFSLDIERRPGTAQSAETIPYRLGSFKPLLDFGGLTFGAEKGSKETGNGGRGSLDIQSSSPNRLPRTHAMAPSSFPKRIVLDALGHDPRGDDENQPFTGSGLLARNASRRTQGGRGSGRGVIGAKGKTLVDLSSESEFANGSLLRKLEAWSVQNGEIEPKIDREKRVEASVRVGEGT